LRFFATIILLLITFASYSQTYNYTYTDPCNGTLQTVVVPINGEVTVGYYGFIETFNYNDFTNGNFETWAQGVFDQFGGNSPCSEIVGVGTVVNVSQGTAFNVIGILNSLTAISDLASATTGATNMLGGTVGSASNASGGESDEEGSNNNQNNGTSNTNEGGSTTSGSNEASSNNGGTGATSENGGAQNPTQAGGASTQGGSNENGNTQTNSSVTNTSENGTNSSNNGSTPTSGNGTSGNGNGGETTSTTPEQTSNSSGNQGEGAEGNGGQSEVSGEETSETEGAGKSNVTGGATTTTKNAPSKSEGGKPTVVASSDFVGFNFRNSEVKTGLKATGGYTALRWDGQRSWGALVDYTSALKGPNATTFYAWIRPKSVTLLSTTLTVGFVGNKSLYGTVAGGQMFSFAKVPKLKAVYMGTVSYGVIQREQFLGTAIIGGVMYDFKIGNRIDIKLMNLLVYVPYVSYYNDLVLQSPWVMLPSIGTNIGISKRFKFNINGGGAWDLKTSALNYTITCGTRMLVGQ
jgi:hypothetical protein